RLCTGLDFRKKSPHVTGCADIRGHDAHFHTALLEVLNKLAGLRTGSAGPAREHKMARTALSQPSSQHSAVASESAGNEIASIRLHLESRTGQFTASRDKGRRECDDNFADMFSTSHEPKRGIDAAGRKGPVGKRAQDTLFDQPRNLLQHLAGQLFITVENRIHSHDMERRIVPERPKWDARVLIDVALTDLDEAAKFGETGKTHRDRAPSECV